jgi:DNA ligase-1
VENKMKYTYAPLYKETSTGAIQKWWMEQDGAKYRSHSGQIEGKITTSAWTDAKPKNVGRSNATTGEQQASSEVDSEYELKRKKGYRDSPQSAKESERFQCMLAEHYNQKAKEADASYAKRMAKIFAADGQVLGDALYVQPKLDGIRCIANKNGLWSREGNPILAVPHIFEMISPIFKSRPDVILDGELYNHELKYDFNKIVSLVKKQKPSADDLLLSSAMVQYWVYDCLIENRQANFFERYDQLIRMQHVVVDNHIRDAFVRVLTYPAFFREDVDAFYDVFLEEGYEGGMVRKNVPYENKRTYSLLKRKEKLDAEFKIISFEEGVGNAAGMAKIAHMEIVIGGKKDTFKADVCGTREECRLYLEHATKYEGKQATIEFQNYTPDGKPRFPKLKVAHLTKRW